MKKKSIVNVTGVLGLIIMFSVALVILALIISAGMK